MWFSTFISDEQQSRKSGKKSSKPKVVENEFEVSPLPGPSTDFACSGSAFRPGIKRTDTSPDHQPCKGRSPSVLATVDSFFGSYS